MAAFLERFRYQPVAQAPNSKVLSGISDEENKHVVREPRITNAHALALLGLGMLLGMSCTLFGVWFFQGYMVLNPELRRASAYSPLFDHIDLELHQMVQNGSYYPSAATISGSPGHQHPNAKADDFWGEFDIERVFPITKAQVVAMGQDPSTAAKLDNQVWGLGEDAYASTFDIHHQIHCLNTLRKYAYWKYYNLSMEQRVDTHFVNHCVNILLQQLQCSGSLSLIPMHWVESEKRPFPDMSIQKKCINFDKLNKWRKDNTLDMTKWNDVMERGDWDKGPGIKQRPVSDAYYEFWGLENPRKKPLNEIHGVP